MDETFIGMGPNPNAKVPDIPLGFGMHLAQNPQAQSAFSALVDGEKTQMINYIQGAATGNEAESRIGECIKQLGGENA